MLIYHPAFDPYHCIFRVMRLLDKLPPASYELDRIRILDFYLLFPSAISEMKFPKKFIRYRKLAGAKNKYDLIRDPLRVFIQLEPFQRAGISELAARGFISSEALSDNKVLAIEKAIPDSLAAALNKANEEDSDFLELLTGPMIKIDLYGESGLRGRTKLFEYRYDPT